MNGYDENAAVTQNRTGRDSIAALDTLKVKDSFTCLNQDGAIGLGNNAS